MEFLTAVTKVAQAISEVGFSVVCVIGLAWFAWYMVNRADQINAENMKQVQERCKEREDILYTELRECRAVNTKAIDTIARYAEKLDTIQHDVNEIKTDVTIIMSKN